MTMKLAIFSRTDDGSACFIEKADGGYTLSQISAKITIDATAFRANQMQFVCSNNRTMAIIDQSALVDSRDWKAVMQTMGFEKVIAGLYFGDTPDESILIVSEPANTNLIEAVEVEANAFGEVAAKFYPSASAVRRRNAAKMELVREINPLDSLASLEKQVDMLTSLVLQLAEQMPDAQTISLAPKLKSLIETCGANAGKTDDQALASIASFKQSLREAQAAYFAKRQGNI